MAKHLTLPALAVLILCGAFSTGCQSTDTVADSVTPASFAGPSILAPAPVAVVKVKPLPQAPVAPKVAKAPSGIPNAWIPVADARPWKWIVIHHSATTFGNAALFDREHKEKGWDELGYHFVIGNGTQSGDGQVEVGPRWPIQKWGAHAKTPDNRFNDYGIGICLVGNFEEQHPTPAQLRSLAKLVGYLQATYHIPPGDVIRHKDTKETACPGRNLDIALVRRMAAQTLVDAGIEEPADTDTAAAQTPDELLTDLPQ